MEDRPKKESEEMERENEDRWDDDDEEQDKLDRENEDDKEDIYSDDLSGHRVHDGYRTHFFLGLEDHDESCQDVGTASSPAPASSENRNLKYGAFRGFYTLL